MGAAQPVEDFVAVQDIQNMVFTKKHSINILIMVIPWAVPLWNMGLSLWYSKK